jgi:hypothetical protein
MSQTAAQLALRNRANARASTGPRTDSGKALSRRNAVRHGLTANPAAGVVEDPRVFERLLAAITDRLQPADPIEAALVHRIATAIWRQQRAVTAETALAAAAAAEIVPERQAVQDYLEIIIDAWKPRTRTFPDPEWSGPKPKTVMKRVWERTGLIDLDERRETEFMRSGVAMTAMLELLMSLADRVDRRERSFGRDECEQLGWLLGEPAACLPQSEGAIPPHEWPRPTRIFRLIGEALNRREDEPFPRKLKSLICQQVATFKAQREVCEDPYTTEAWEHKRGAALLLDEGVMNRLLRYETHADRTLLRALETLARLRGVRVESLSASMTTPAGPGGTLRVKGSTVRIGSPGLAAAG